MLSLRSFCIAKREHAGIDEQPAIAIFGKAGEAIDIGHARCRIVCSGSMRE